MNFKINPGFLCICMCQLRGSNNAGERLEDNRDILSGRHDPNALKVRPDIALFLLTPESRRLLILDIFLI